MDLLALFSLDQVEQWFEWGGYFILFGLLFACGLGLPMPEDIPLLLAGFFIAQGKMNVVIACFVAWLGIMGGDCVLYSFGRRYGLEITRVPFIGKHVTKERILRAEELFERWGIWVVAIGRMFAGIRGAMVVCASGEAVVVGMVSLTSSPWRLALSLAASVADLTASPAASTVSVATWRPCSIRSSPMVRA